MTAWCSTIGLPKLVPLARVGERGIERRARHADRLRGDADAPGLEVRERDAVAVAFARRAGWLAGTSQFSNTICAVSDARWPSFSSMRATT